METNYSSSWYNRMTIIVGRLPVPYWLVYPLFGLLITVIGLYLWTSDASSSAGEIEPLFFIICSQISYSLVFMHYLDKQSLKLIEDANKILKENVSEEYDLAKLLSVLPAKSTNIVCVLFLVLPVGLFLAGYYSDLGTGSNLIGPESPFGIYTLIVFSLLWVINGLLAYHAWRQVKVVNYILANLVDIHPFHQKELFAFSRFTLKTSLLFVWVAILWILFDPGFSSLILFPIGVIIGGIVFVSPLIGTRNILVKEKETMLDSNGQQIEKIITIIEKRIAENSDVSVNELAENLAALESIRTRIKKIATWPWNFATLRQFAGAVTIPLIIWLLQYFLSEFL